MSTYKDLIILIAEDDEGHAELIQEGLRETGLLNQIIRFKNGVETWEYLNNLCHNDKYDEHNDYLLLLDINMPRMDGIEVLRRIKTNSCLKEMPVMMLTTTDDPREVDKCYELGCNIYITKPVDFIKFTETLQRIGLFLQIIKV